MRMRCEPKGTGTVIPQGRPPAIAHKAAIARAQPVSYLQKTVDSEHILSIISSESGAEAVHPRGSHVSHKHITPEMLLVLLTSMRCRLLIRFDPTSRAA